MDEGEKRFWRVKHYLTRDRLEEIRESGYRGADPREVDAIIEIMDDIPIDMVALSMMPSDIVEGNGAWDFVPYYLAALEVPRPVEIAVMSLRGLQRVRFLVELCREHNALYKMHMGGKQWAIIPAHVGDIRDEWL